MKKICILCKKEYEVKLNYAEKSKYCSRVCKYEYWRKNKVQFSPQTQFKKGDQIGEKNSNWNGGRFLGGRGYYFIYAPNHPFVINKRYIAEHRFIMEEWLKSNDPTNLALIIVNGIKVLDQKWLVHHKDHNKLNNKIENLMLIKRPDHQRLHHKGKILSEKVKKKISLAKIGQKLLQLTKDKIAKTRIERYGKLTPEKVVTIKKLYTTKRFSQQKIASQFGITQTMVSHIIRGTTWKHI